MQQLPVLHAKLRTAVDDLRFQLELNNRNGGVAGGEVRWKRSRRASHTTMKSKFRA